MLISQNPCLPNISGTFGAVTTSASYGYSGAFTRTKYQTSRVYPGEHGTDREFTFNANSGAYKTGIYGNYSVVRPLSRKVLFLISY